MRRLRLQDRLWLLLFGPLWLVCFALAVGDTVRGPIFFSSLLLERGGSDGYAIVSWQLVETEPRVPAGAKLVRVGSTDLAGARPHGPPLVAAGLESRLRYASRWRLRDPSLRPVPFPAESTGPLAARCCSARV